MLSKFEIVKGRMDRVSFGLDRLLYVLSAYSLPIVIGLMSFLTLFAWKTQYQLVEPQQLEISVIREPTGLANPADVVNRLIHSKSGSFFDTQLSQDAFWFSFTAPSGADKTLKVVEFPSRHAMDVSCWDAQSMTVLGAGTRLGVSGGISLVKAGFSLDISRDLAGNRVVCRTSAIGPARLSALAWEADDLQTSSQEFHRKSGLLDGGIIVLSIFVLITAFINRNALYILFSAWLLVNLRMGAHSAGWDTQWLGNTVPLDWLLRIRPLTLAIYYVLTVTLFKSLFREDLEKVATWTWMRITQWTCLPLLGLSLILPYQTFLPLLWVATGLSSSVLVYYLTKILQKTHSRVAMWYSASITVTLVASLYEVLAAALGIKGMIGSVNFVTAALSSSLLAALAIAEHMRQEHVQRLALQAELKDTYDAMPIGLFTLDLRGRFMSANPALLSMLGPNVLDDGGNSWQQYFADGAWTQLHQMLHSKTEVELEIKGRKMLGFTGTKRFLVKATLARERIEGSLQDVTEKSRATEDLYFLANHDSLTKVLNRRGIEKALNNAIVHVADDNPMALAYLDLDRFKLINDLFGHGAGDEVLQQVCARVSNLLGAGLQFGRVGGDEFVIVFPSTPIERASVLCRGIVDSIGTQAYRLGEKAFYVRGSIGLVEVSSGMKFNDAMSTADRACRQAKAANTSGLVVYEKNAPAFQQHQAELKLIALLATSSATEGLYLEMQPIMSLVAPQDSLNFEVLLRMRDKEGKFVPTDRLINAAESSGRMGMIDRWVLKTTLAWLDRNHAQLIHTKFVCMNLSGSSLNDEKFLQDVYTQLEQNPHIVGKLCLEITESVALHDLDNTRRFVDKVRSYGVTVALDDFGAGYTSFSYLKEFTADLLKIDGSFIVDMNKHPANVAIVEAIISLAKNLGMKVIAEWAEDYATVQTLTEIGVDYVQGYVIARPQHPDNMLSAESAASFIKDEELRQFVDLLGRSGTTLAQVDLFTEGRPINVH